MNAIKLPVRVEKKPKGWWWDVVDADDIDICNTGASKILADKIAIALNNHDQMVNALKFYGRLPDKPHNRVNRDDWRCEMETDEGRIARAALAKLEE